MKQYLEKPKKKKTMGQLHKDLWKVFSEFSRLKDADRHGMVKCCSCGTPKNWKEVDAGHYISRTHWAVRYNEKNVHAQCKGCNAFKQGNPVPYREYLVNRYGLDEVLKLEYGRNMQTKFNRFELMYKITEYKEKVKKLKKELGL